MFNFTREDTSILAKWWRNIDKQALFVIIFLFLLGLFFSFSSTSQLIGEKLNKQTYFFFIRHFIFVLIIHNTKIQCTSNRVERHILCKKCER